MDTIALNNFDNYLKGKGLPDQAISYFSCLKFVNCGQREQKEFKLNATNARVEHIGMAV